MPQPPDIETRTYAVTGMSCDHCARSVTEEVSAVAGVETVTVDLPAGRIAVTGSALDDDRVRAAVVEAGYEMVS